MKNCLEAQAEGQAKYAEKLLLIKAVPGKCFHF